MKYGIWEIYEYSFIRIFFLCFSFLLDAFSEAASLPVSKNVNMSTCPQTFVHLPYNTLQMDLKHNDKLLVNHCVYTQLTTIIHSSYSDLVDGS